jgi:glycerophosphoryl diester phosphodiesterase
MRRDPLVIGHRGAPGYRPEHTRSSFALAIEQGADAIEVDVVLTSDGVPIVRHDRELGATTDIASRPSLAPLRRRGDADGLEVVGWFAEDLGWAQVRELRAVERMPPTYPDLVAPDSGEPVLRLGEVAAMAAEAGVLLVVELKEATRHAALGLPLVASVLAELAAVDPLPAVVVESFEKAPLLALASAGVPWRLVYLMEDIGTAPDEALRGGPSYAAELADPAALRAFSGVSLPTALITPYEVERLHAVGLEVWTWTLRPENRFLPAAHRRGARAGGFGDWPGAWAALLDAGVDGVFADHPDLAVLVRDVVLQRGGRRPAAGATPSSATTAPETLRA